MSTRSIPRTVYDNTTCTYCGAEPDSPCHTKSGAITEPHANRIQLYDINRMRGNWRKP